MGGAGSGARLRHAPKTDMFHRVDLASFQQDWFKSAYTGSITWSRGGRKMASIGYRLWPNRMQLHYKHTRGGEEHAIEDTFMFAFTDQPFGGQRRWIVCPSCQRRCAVLYGGARFRCRQCQGAVYQSQYETFPQLPWSKCHRARENLGGEPGLASPFPNKPKGMHWRTYNRLRDTDWNAFMALESQLEAMQAGL